MDPLGAMDSTVITVDPANTDSPFKIKQHVLKPQGTCPHSNWFIQSKIEQQFMVWLVMFHVVQQSPLNYLWMAWSTIVCQSIPTFMFVPFHTPVDEQGVSTLSVCCRLGGTHCLRKWFVLLWRTILLEAWYGNFGGNKNCGLQLRIMFKWIQVHFTLHWLLFVV